MKKAILFFFLALLLLWVTGIVLENFFNVDLDKYFNGGSPAPQAASPAPAPAADVLPADWKTYKNDDFHFSITSPYELQESKPSVPVTIKAMLAKGHSPDMKVMIQVDAHEIPNYTPDLNKIMDLQIKMLQIDEKIFQNLQVTTTPVTVADTPGVLAQGTYQSTVMTEKIEMGIMLFKIQKGAIFLDLMVLYTQTDENKAMADKIIHSLSFSN